MKSLITLAGLITKSFSDFSGDQLLIQKVKNNEPRDVVTNIDVKLHNVTREFLATEMNDVQLISEEGNCDSETLFINPNQTYFLLDPLDGSNNLNMDWGFYGYMGCLIKAGNITSSLVCLPTQNVYLVFEHERLIWSRKLSSHFQGNTIYYAYPPKLDYAKRTLQSDILEVSDKNSAGIYRYGSACLGLYNTLIGKHIGFVAQTVRLWDIVPYIPILLANGFYIKYAISNQEISFIASKEVNFMSALSSVFEKHNILLTEYGDFSSILKET